MAADHDRSSGFPAASSVTDPLSGVLRSVRLSGAVFFVVDASSPWAVEVPPGDRVTPVLLPGAQHVISYHVITQGPCWGGLPGLPPVRLESGDVLVVPHGDPYTMASAPDGCSQMDLAEVLEFFRLMAARQLPYTVSEGGGGRERIGIVCGFLCCDVRPFNPLLAALPPLLHLRAPSAPDRLKTLIGLAIGEAREPTTGGDCVMLRLSELMFIEVVRRHLASLPEEQTGWLAGLRDPMVGRALALLHQRPAEDWTLERLSREAGLSRSVLAERFAHFVGRPPMQYLAQWRMQLAARLLADGAAKVSAVAREVGYDSEAAFSRAFKKAVGVPPAAWRRGA